MKDVTTETKLVYSEYFSARTGAKAQAGAEADTSSVTGFGCYGLPTGIAHTYMAAENLENTGRSWGLP